MNLVNCCENKWDFTHTFGDSSKGYRLGQPFTINCADGLLQEILWHSLQHKILGEIEFLELNPVTRSYPDMQKPNEVN